VKNSRIFEIFKNRKKFVEISFITSLITAKYSNSHNTSYTVENFSAVYYTDATVEWERWAVQDSDSGEDSEAAVIPRVCNRTMNCWRVNKSWIVDITEFIVQQLSSVFATKSLLELVGDACDNLKFTNFKIDSFEIRKKKSLILENFKIRKIQILNLWSTRLVPGLCATIP